MAKFESGGKASITDDGMLLIPSSGGGVACILSFCEAPDCPCRDARVSAVKLPPGTCEVLRQDDQLAIRTAADRAGAPAVVPEQTWNLWIDVDTGTVRDPEDDVIDISSQPDLVPLVEALDVSMLDKLARMWSQQKRQRIHEGSVRSDLDLRSWISGDKLAWAEVFNTVRADGYHYQGSEYFAVDYYCVMPDCDCDDVDLAIAGEELAGEVKVMLGSGEIELVPAPGGAEMLPILWNRFLKRHHGIGILRQRRAAMKRFAREYITPVSEQRHEVSRDAKVGRNQPCPCGSGKKYKRCCGR
jgi:hypothetical protein